MDKPKHHVIFLGAGASASSGYPLGNGLRLMLSSKNRLLSSLRNERSELATGSVHSYVDGFASAMSLFREGGFTTVDEFSKLSSDKNASHPREMKKLVQLALGLHNPEDTFENSDYYGFIQCLFEPGELNTLRKDITILSYNYDIYLDYLLLRAFKRRQTIANIQPNAVLWPNKLTSGFFKMDDTAWTKDTAGFNYFKLHGSIGYALGICEYPHGLFFENPAKARIERLVGADAKAVIPPIAFPWEIFDSDGNFISESDFVFLNDPSELIKRNGASLYNLYKKIWEGARNAVQKATKISFVGLSAHPYMQSGLNYLFKGKNSTAEMVVANKENERWTDAPNIFLPATLCGRIAAQLQDAGYSQKFRRSWADFSEQKHATPGIKIHDNPDMTLRYSFEEFIRTEM